MRRAVVDLASSRPLWRVPPATVKAVRRALGRGWEVVEVKSLSSSDGDGARASRESVNAARNAEIYFGWGVPAAVARGAGASLRWAHTAAAGVGGTLSPELRATGATVTNSRGTHAVPMADWAVVAIGCCVRGFHHAFTAQRAGRWTKDAFTDGTITLKEFPEVRVGIVGLGGVGAAIARRCHGLSMTVRGVRRHPSLRKPRGVTWVGGPGQLTRLARTSDVLVIAAPETKKSVHLVDDRVLRALPRGGYVVNLSRGALLDEKALLMHLDSGHLAGAVLDVFTTEPLPRRHPFWRHDRVLITPHVSGVSDRFWPRETELMVENIHRFRSGRRLKNVVNQRAGY